MRLILSRTLWFLLLFTPLLTGLLRSEGHQDKDTEHTARLIQQLGSAGFTKRDHASIELLKLGEKALPALQRAAATSQDPELRRRAEDLIETLTPRARKSAATGMELVLIDRGDLIMGAPQTERFRRVDEAPHRVGITKPFYLGKYEVTQAEYQKVMEKTPSWFAKTGQGKDKIAGTDTSSFPVEYVSWFDAIEFCNRLSQLDALSPYYKLTDVKRHDSGSIKFAKIEILGGPGYRLPTEAEWEHACRAWTVTPFHFGLRNSGREANLKPGPGAGGYGGDPTWKTLDRTAQVGSYAGNHWGLGDMHGNVAEWCGDWYDPDYYAASPANDPKGPAAGKHRVVRGGSWLVSEGSCRSASRFFLLPDDFNYNVGFRVARQP